MQHHFGTQFSELYVFLTQSFALLVEKCHVRLKKQRHSYKRRLFRLEEQKTNRHVSRSLCVQNTIPAPHFRVFARVALLRRARRMLSMGSQTKLAEQSPIIPSSVTREIEAAFMLRAQNPEISRRCERRFKSEVYVQHTCEIQRR